MVLILAAKKEKRRKTLFPRLGFQKIPAELKKLLQKGRRPVWIHALSVGEVNSVQPLVLALARMLPPCELVVSASTLTGFQTACRLFSGQGISVVFSPYDLFFSAASFLERIHPRFAFVVETDVWPNMMHLLRKKHIPCALVNARLSLRSFGRYKKVRALPRFLFSRFDWIFTQSPADARHFKDLGVCPDKVVFSGNIKFDRPLPRLDAPGAREIRERLGLASRDRLWLAGSTHPGEEEMVLAAFKDVKAGHPGLRLAMAPRNPDRAGEVADLCREKGLAPALWSRTSVQKPALGETVMVVDAMGWLFPLYQAADAAFVGGSLVPFGGHNPLEPACLGVPVFFGPHMNDFSMISDLLLEAGAARQVENGPDLARGLGQVLKNPDQGIEMGKKGPGGVSGPQRRGGPDFGPGADPAGNRWKLMARRRH